jgi:hypothetical protein
VQRPEVGVLSLIDSRLRNPVLYRGLLRGSSWRTWASGQVVGTLRCGAKAWAITEAITKRQANHTFTFHSSSLVDVMQIARSNPQRLGISSTLAALFGNPNFRTQMRHRRDHAVYLRSGLLSRFAKALLRIADSTDTWKAEL